MATKSDEILKVQKVGAEFKKQRLSIEGKADIDLSNVTILPDAVKTQLQGEPGPAGVAGAQGPQGETGPQGPQGIQGDAGYHSMEH